MSRRHACLCVWFFAATVLGDTPLHADPTPVLDQEIPPLSSGQLAAVEIYLNNPFLDIPDQITVSIRSVHSSGFPSLLPSDNLTVATMPISSVPTPVGFVRVDFQSPLPVVNLGDDLAVIMRADGPSGNLNWHGMFRDVYPRGSFYSRFYKTDGAWIANVADFSMRTYVIPVPEPSGVLIMMGMLLASAVIRRRKSVPHNRS